MHAAQVILDLTLSDGTVICSALLVGLLLLRGLQRIYPVFFFYWLFDLLMSALPLVTPDFQTQVTAVLVCMTIRWVLYFLLVIELVDRILGDHPGIARLGRRLVQVVMVSAIGGSIYTLQFDSTRQAALDRRLQLIFQLERVIAGCLLVLLLAIVIFLWFFPVRLNRNTKAYCLGFSVLFAAKAIAPFLINTHGIGAVGQADDIALGGLLFCQVLWLFSITRRGAEATPAFTRRWSTGDQQKALTSLGDIERRISRARGR